MDIRVCCLPSANTRLVFVTTIAPSSSRSIVIWSKFPIVSSLTISISSLLMLGLGGTGVVSTGVVVEGLVVKSAVVKFGLFNNFLF